MLNQIKNVLKSDELNRIRKLAETLEFVDGKVSNPHSTVKNNQQLRQNDPASEEPGKIVRDAIFRHPEVRDIVFPKTMARPTLARYEPGMNYGDHVDAAVFVSQPVIRSDVSCTVFISPPESYDGGELVIEAGSETLEVKGNAGDAVIYPSTFIHRVSPVTRGVRLVAITWFQSMIRDQFQRAILQSLESALGHPSITQLDGRARVQLEGVKANLFRMWAET